MGGLVVDCGGKNAQDCCDRRGGVQFFDSPEKRFPALAIKGY